ncbi:MAG: transposase [candidate division WOR-3 bacterium]
MSLMSQSGTNKGYINAIRAECPNAMIIADKFHILRMVNYALDFTRAVLQRQAKKGKKKQWLY